MREKRGVRFIGEKNKNKLIGHLHEWGKTLRFPLRVNGQTAEEGRDPAPKTDHRPLDHLTSGCQDIRKTRQIKLATLGMRRENTNH